MRPRPKRHRPAYHSPPRRVKVAPARRLMVCWVVMNHRPRPALALRHRLSFLSLVCSLAAWLLLGPLADAGMNFMLWTWLWPAVLGAGAAGSAGLALRVTPA